MSSIYLASRYSRREELCGYKALLEERGHKVPARWLLGDHQAHGLEAVKAVNGDGPIPTHQAVKFAEDNVEDILNADTLICFTEKPRKHKTRGGRHTEFGIFLGLRFMTGQWDRRRSLLVVGPIEHIFYALPEVDGRYKTFNRLLRAVDDEMIVL